MRSRRLANDWGKKTCEEWTSEEGGIIRLFSPETWEGSLQTFPRNEGSKEMCQMETFRGTSATLSLHTVTSSSNKRQRVVSAEGQTQATLKKRLGPCGRRDLGDLKLPLVPCYCGDT